MNKLLNKKALKIKLDNRSKYLRQIIVQSLIGGGRGHMGSAMSLVEILRVLYDEFIKINPKKPKNENRDRLILSKGHGCLALYSILADKGFEFGENEGLGWIKGSVIKLKADVLPHIGWNNIEIKKQSPIFSNLKNMNDFYFVNSYAFKVYDKNLIISETDYGDKFCSALQKDNIFGVQFHPEKSQKAGEVLINNFITI